MGNHLFLVSILLSASLAITCNASYEGFVSCMGESAKFLFDQTDPHFTERFNQSIQNGRKFSEYSAKPAFIFLPTLESEIQTAVRCCKQQGLQIRVKSGGHDYEGLSLLAGEPYIVIDLYNHQEIDVDVMSETAWVQTGATLGGLYYSISQKTNILGFPGGVCPSVGTGGHISGGGWGWLVRKYGLAADNVIDARLVDADGNLLNRTTMGEDLFWAIRGGGAGSFGIVTSWQLKLVRVPPVVTWAKIIDFNQTALDKFVRWQTVAPQLPKDVFVGVVAKTGNSSFKAIFKLQFLGPKAELFPMMNQRFPELGLTEQHCREMSWIDAVYTNIESSAPMAEVMNTRKDGSRSYKAKSDYVTAPIPTDAILGAYERFLKTEEHDIDRLMVCYPLGGMMEEVPPEALPFPHRKGNLYGIEYMVKWPANQTAGTERFIQWIDELYAYMEPYVSQNPRRAYLNYKDLDLGSNGPNGSASYDEARAWGEKYFFGNFESLAKVKSKVDPCNYFRNEQSIPLFP